jgi:kynurenine formamidase
MRSSLDEETALGFLQSLSNWGRWGADDERGTLNLITPRERKAAAALVREGITVSCAREIVPTPDIADRYGPAQRFMTSHGQGLGDPERVWDGGSGPNEPGSRQSAAGEYIGMAYHGHTISHLDALAHQFFDRRMYNGFAAELVTSRHGATRNAVTAAAQGIVTRGVLLDVAALHGTPWLADKTPIRVADLEGAEKLQGVRVGEGDVLLVRNGYSKRRLEQGSTEPFVTGRAGIHAECLPWLHERSIAVLGTDSATDLLPSGYEELEAPVHVVGMVAMGLWIMDNLDLEDLSLTSAKLGRWEFMFTAGPLRFRGATGSPINPLAVF